MKTARKSLFRNIVVRFSILTFLLMIIISGVWAFFTRNLLLQAGIPAGKALSQLLPVVIFILVFIFVILIISILLGIIFIEGFRAGYLELTGKISALKNAAFGTRIPVNSADELGVLAGDVNLEIEKLENEITKDLKTAADEHLQLVEEQSKTGFEQKKIYEEKIKLEYVLTRIKDGVILLSKSRKVVIMNKAAEELTGFRQMEAVGKPVHNIIKFFEEDREILPDEYSPGASLSPASPHVESSATKEEIYQKKHVKIETQQATEKYVDLVCMKLTLIQTQDLGYMIIMHDLSARLEIEKKRTELLSAFAKELKLPSDLISKNLNTESLNLVSAQAGLGYLSIIMENLLTIGAIEAGSLQVDLEQNDLAVIIKNAIAVLQPVALEKQISLLADIKEDMSASVSCDQSRMYQIVLNLLLNAIWFTGPGGSINISLSQSESEYIIQIQDTGIGIKTESMSELFNKFSVAENDRGVETGIGLGLYVCKKLIELQSGKVWLDSVEGRGTVANVSLPKAAI